MVSSNKTLHHRQGPGRVDWPHAAGAQKMKTGYSIATVTRGHVEKMVGVKGFEPSTPCTPCKCATRLRHTPTRPQLYTESQASKESNARISNNSCFTVPRLCTGVCGSSPATASVSLMESDGEASASHASRTPCRISCSL